MYSEYDSYDYVEREILDLLKNPSATIKEDLRKNKWTVKHNAKSVELIGGTNILVVLRSGTKELYRGFAGNNIRRELSVLMQRTHTDFFMGFFGQLRQQTR